MSDCYFNLSAGPTLVALAYQATKLFVEVGLHLLHFKCKIAQRDGV
jgi:hypothetical protein